MSVFIRRCCECKHEIGKSPDDLPGRDLSNYTLKRGEWFTDGYCRLCADEIRARILQRKAVTV